MRPDWLHGLSLVRYAPPAYGYGQAGARFRVLCSDGRTRIATATAEPDTMETVPARVSVRGRTVSGHVYHRGNLDYRTPGWPAYADDDPTPLYRFAAYTYRRNGAMLPAWPDHAPAIVGADR